MKLKDEVVRLESFNKASFFEVRICFKYRSAKNYRPKTHSRARWLLQAARKRMKAIA